jgi:hypothetical protein
MEKQRGTVDRLGIDELPATLLKLPLTTPSAMLAA